MRPKRKGFIKLRGLHLKKRGSQWHYYRRRPKAYAEIEPREWITFSLQTSDIALARAKAAQISLDLDKHWQSAKEKGKVIPQKDQGRNFQAAQLVLAGHGFTNAPISTVSDDELLSRLRQILGNNTDPMEQRIILGLVDEPKLSLSDGFDRFWAHIRDEWSRLSRDQIRTKRNIYLKSIRNFEEALGEIHLYDIERRHALAFREWWIKRVETEGLKPYTGNREINSLRRLINVNFDIDGVNRTNPFLRIRLKEEAEVSRVPFDRKTIETMLLPGAMPKLHADFELLLRLLVNTGMRPVEAIGLELDDINLDHEVPHIHVRKNSIRGLKTSHSERLLPLLGVSFHAAHELVAQGGWGKRAGKNMYATSIINRNLRQSGLVRDPKQSLYSMRHWFQDQLTKLDVIDRAQAQLMGHRFHRPKYGYGKDLGELHKIIARFAIE